MVVFFENAECRDHWFFTALAMCGQGQSSFKGGRAHYPVCFVHLLLPSSSNCFCPPIFLEIVGHELAKGCFFFSDLMSGGGQGMFF